MAAALFRLRLLCQAGSTKILLRSGIRSSPYVLRKAQSAAYHPHDHHPSQHIPPLAKYGGRNTATLIPGDGVGPEIIIAVKDIFRHVGVPVDFEELNVSGLDIIDEDSHEEVMDHAVTSIKRNGVAIKGNIFTPLDTNPDFRSLNLELRLRLDLFANVIRCKSIPSIKTRHNDVDLVIIRQNTEGEYSQLEHQNIPGVVENFKITTEEKCVQIAEYAFNFAKRYGRKKITAVHKANIMKLGDGLFLHCCNEEAKKYPDIEYNSMIIDNCCMQLVSNPNQFDVMLLPNLYGNIVSNIGASLVGGPGIVPGENYGPDYAVFESGSRHTGLDIKGLGISNPISMLFASTLMLKHLEFTAYADLINKAIMDVVDKGILTADVGGTASTTEFLSALKQELDESPKIKRIY